MGRQPYASGRGQMLHARRQMGGQADCRVFERQIAVNSAHDHFARIDANPNLQLHAMSPARLVVQLQNRGLHSQGRVTAAYRMIFVSQRGAEQRHDSIAENLVHGSFKSMHRFHHLLQNWIDDFARLFRVEVGNGFERPFDVGKQNRDLLALAFDGGARGTYAISQMRRWLHALPCRSLDGRRLWRFRDRPKGWNRGSARNAELRLWWEFGTALRANRRKPASATHAKLGLRRIFFPTVGTLGHAASLSFSEARCFFRRLVFAANSKHSEFSLFRAPSECSCSILFWILYCGSSRFARSPCGCRIESS